MSTLSRTPTPTAGLITPSEASTAPTDRSESPDPDSDNDDDYDDPAGPPVYINSRRFNSLIETLTAITTASVDPAVGTDTASLRRYYSTRWKAIAEDPTYADMPLTTPPCPKLQVSAVDQVRYADNCEISCPCCLPDELPSLDIVAEEVEGGVITYSVFVEKLRLWLYGDYVDPSAAPSTGADVDVAAVASLQSVVDGIPAGEAGVKVWNCMSAARREDETDLMGRQVFLYFAKPLVGGGTHNSYREDDTEGCGRGTPVND
ncbi:hypothetical protein Dda_0221 [Drechslerella dactyloides]|uniref:Uncharacterized protein n=1 Tax=Drechslerella dactyloides TaxID=74499 RepID=A0AAD6J4G2_DREDA|nr:hypothetical protein Dda_0221 [Drechslerella dactyloides]